MTIQSNSGRPVRTAKIQIEDFDQTATAQPITADGAGTDADGWIDLAEMSVIPARSIQPSASVPRSPARCAPTQAGKRRRSR